MTKTLAILGAGQLGRMLALAAARMGVRCRFLDPAAAGPEPCACAGLGEIIAAEFADRAALDRLAEGADAVTYEFENVPAEAVEHLSRHSSVAPPPLALRTAQDRLLEKQAFEACGIPTNNTVAWEAGAPGADAARALLTAVEQVGPDVVVKTRRMGYDGKGQTVLRGMDEATAYARRQNDARPTVPMLVEALVPFARELSIIAVRSREGDVRAYPLVQNTHADGILRRTVAPAPGITPALQRHAENSVRTLMSSLNYVGVMALELFEVARPTGPSLLANEIAPRVHNSGHWTIEAAHTSQFENHVRAVLGLPLGDTAAVGHSVMVNLIGVRPDPAKVLAIPGVTLHWYAKSVRAGRKVGHVTVWADTPQEAHERAARVEALL